MEEERARQQQQRTTTEGAGSSNLETVPEQEHNAMDTVPVAGAENEDEEDRMLAEALALSTQDGDVEMEDGGWSFKYYTSFTSITHSTYQEMTMKSMRKKQLPGLYR
jgi:hypothetical protein